MKSQFDWNDLLTALDGALLLPGSTAFDTAVASGTLSRKQTTTPSAVVQASNVTDVANAIRFSRQHHLHISPRAGGHCFAGRSSAGDIVLDVSAFNTVTFAGDLVVVGAGTLLADLDRALEPQNLAIPTGCGRTVGIAGLTLGGGLGLLGRRYGLTCDRLRAAQVVLADGSVVDCDARYHADLYWALRGAGGGQFGVVVSLTFETVPAPDVLRFHLSWPAHAAMAGIQAWQHWSPTGAPELSAELRVHLAPGRSQPSTQLLGTLLLDADGPSAAEGSQMLDGFIRHVGADPQTDVRRVENYYAAKRYLTGQAVHPDEDQHLERGGEQRELSRSEFFEQPLPEEVVPQLITLLTEGPRSGQSRQLSFMPWGGAYNETPSEETAFAHRGELFLLEHVVTVDAAASDAQANGEHWLHRSSREVAPWGSGRVYPNFPILDLDDWPYAYHGDNYARLLMIKQTYDPDHLFTFPQAVGTHIGRKRS
jgi:FAD/FMN-containing dehydrogenase